MKKIVIIFVFSLLLVILNNSLVIRAYTTPSPELQTIQLKSRSIEYESSGKLLSELIKLFYEERNYNPAWCSQTEIYPQAYILLKIIKEADREGLDPSAYYYSLISNYVRELENKIIRNSSITREVALSFELLMTKVYLDYTLDLLTGYTRNGMFNKMYDKHELIKKLNRAIEQESLGKFFIDLYPGQELYFRMRKALSHLRNISSKDWPRVGYGPPLQRGDYSKRIIELRRRLYLSGDLSEEQLNTGTYFDRELEKAVRKFQRRHGLKDSGIVDDKTIEALNIPVKEKINKIIINMERLRWLPRDNPDLCVMVNIPEYKLKVIREDKVILESKVIVGSRENQTPSFNDSIEYIVLNPYWYIPDNITRYELLPQIKKDPDYLDKHNIQILSGFEGEVKIIPEDQINWDEVTPENFSYKLRQKPGPGNSLGSIKFLFPNDFNVYLHDTPSRGLFEYRERALSHGCIRVERPLELAKVLISQSNWSYNEVISIINSGNREVIELKNPVPIYLIYLTVWVDDDGVIHYREDIYQRDKKLVHEMMKKAVNDS
ncbi:L,D-transpeptidase family protein [Halothermothrix orenii]|uniref:Peptidoglycan-binding domain 1 protein n=1 Tax=Halothermothrix orenii (strain H 168 / OCM 544 / DSM 9562) TaxID=373903 RepID=B8D2H3_HALOH|nr:L,D-transpeptidase family protein [Halothermothrix orenii]ACL69400.1 Peptidoglycan-binding domain 1 protein [Halothermothrix orenii H 168]